MPPALPTPSPASADAPLLRFGGCVLDVARRELRVHGQLRATPPKVFDLLVLLVRQHHRMVAKSELADVLWPGRVVSDSALARTVMLARRAIDGGVDGATAIRNLHGLGYRFVVPLHPMPDGARAVAPAARSGAADAPRPSPADARAANDPGLAEWAEAEAGDGTGTDHAEGAHAKAGAVAAPDTDTDTDTVLPVLRRHADGAMRHERWAKAEALYHAAWLLRPDADLLESRLQALQLLDDARVPVVARLLLGAAGRRGDRAQMRRTRLHMALWQPAGSAPAAADTGALLDELLPDEHTEVGPGPAPSVAELLCAARLTYRQGQFEVSRRWAQAAQRLAEARARALPAEAGDIEVDRALGVLALLDLTTGHADAAAAVWRPLARRHARRRQPVSAAQAGVWLALAALESHRTDDAAAALQPAMDELLVAEPRGVVRCLMACAALAATELNGWPEVHALWRRLKAHGVGQPHPAVDMVAGLRAWHGGPKGMAPAGCAQATPLAAPLADLAELRGHQDRDAAAGAAGGGGAAGVIGVNVSNDADGSSDTVDRGVTPDPSHRAAAWRHLLSALGGLRLAGHHALAHRLAAWMLRAGMAEGDARAVAEMTARIAGWPEQGFDAGLVASRRHAQAWTLWMRGDVQAAARALRALVAELPDTRAGAAAGLDLAVVVTLAESRRDAERDGKTPAAGDSAVLGWPSVVRSPGSPRSPVSPSARPSPWSSASAVAAPPSDTGAADFF